MPGGAREAAPRPRAEIGTVEPGPTPAEAPTERVRELPVEGFLPALLFSPAGSEQARLIVATHGAGGAPEWECDYWRQLSAGSAFLLCLRGKSMGGGSYYYPNHHELDGELRAAERAARAAEARILPGDGVYAGFSQGASMGSAIVARHAATFPYVVLIEGFELWNIPRARSFARAGGRRVLFACGNPAVRFDCSRVRPLHWPGRARCSGRVCGRGRAHGWRRSDGARGGLARVALARRVNEKGA
jgi:hypothetical protein